MSEADQKQIFEAMQHIFGDTKEAKELVERLSQGSLERPLQLVDFLDLYTQIARYNRRWHEKYLIADCQKAILGGMNTADEYLQGGLDATVMVGGMGRLAWRDTDIFIEGEGAWDASENFA